MHPRAKQWSIGHFLQKVVREGLFDLLTFELRLDGSKEENYADIWDFSSRKRGNSKWKDPEACWRNNQG